MTLNALVRKIHHWGSIIILVQFGLVATTGVLLLLKKEIDWIQPPTARGAVADAPPSRSFEALFAAARSVEELQLQDWTDLARVDVKPGKGIVKFVSENNWEAQIDTETGAVVQVAYRRSDVIERLHDGSFFADWVKLFVFLPTGIIMITLWATGGYLFFLPHVKRALRRSKKARRREALAADGASAAVLPSKP
ncbi:MAG: PepSY-associated TM helix domain-containing protein [Pseudomonadota bacterium]